MATVESLKKYVKDVMAKRGNIPDYKPIYAIMLFENPDKIQYDEENGKPTKFWFPELGRTGGPGYYHDLESAVKAMHENAGDIRETIFNAGFVIAKFPGLYNTMGPEGRVYFLWDDRSRIPYLMCGSLQLLTFTFPQIFKKFNIVIFLAYAGVSLICQQFSGH